MKTWAVKVNGETICYVSTGSYLSLKVAKEILSDKLMELGASDKDVRHVKTDDCIEFLTSALDCINPS